MNEAGSALKAWETFYVIVGSSAGALTGLQFVVLTLVAEAGALPSTKESVSAFGSPNVVHFCAALLASAIFTAPWGSLAPPGVAIALLGAGGIVYSIVVLRRALRQHDYRPVLEDWVFHAVLPMLAYVALIYAGFALSHGTLYVVGAANLLLLFVGIHNAWDTVTYITFRQLPRHRPAPLHPAAGRSASARDPDPARPPATVEEKP